MQVKNQIYHIVIQSITSNYGGLNLIGISFENICRGILKLVIKLFIRILDLFSCNKSVLPCFCGKKINSTSNNELPELPS